MIIGLTYDLKDDYLRRGFDAEAVAEFDGRETIDALQAALEDLDCETERIGALPALVERLSAGERWDLVFNIAEGMFGYGREAQVPALLDAYRIPYTFSDPLTLAVTLHKAFAKRVVRDLGLPTAEFAVVESPADVQRVDLPPPLFAKPVAEGSSKGIGRRSLIRRRAELAEVCGTLLAAYGQAVLVERFLPGREFTVGIVGTGEAARAVGVLEIQVRSEGATAYSRRVKGAADYRRLVGYRLCPEPELAAECDLVALGAWRGLGCRDAGRVDLRCDAGGRPHFLEVNPLAGLHPVDSDLTILAGLVGLPYRRLIGAILESALSRCGAGTAASAARAAR